MTDTPDPAAAVKAMMEQWVALSSAVAGHAVGQAGDLSAAAQAGVGATVGQALAGLDLATRTDVRALAAAVVALDARLERIEAALAAR